MGFLTGLLFVGWLNNRALADDYEDLLDEYEETINHMSAQYDLALAEVFCGPCCEFCGTCGPHRFCPHCFNERIVTE
jgi:hypothetical protein